MRVRRSVGAALFSIAMLASCRDDELAGPARVAASSSAGQDSRPFYYYQGEPVYLDVDSSGFVVESHVSDPTAAVTEALSGLPVASLSRLPQLSEHWIVRLPAVANRTAYRAALTRMRASDRFRFAANLHRWSGDGSPVTLLGRLAVRFKPSAGQASIDSLIRALGLRVIRVPQPDSGRFSYVLGYPRDGDPLEIAAIADRSPLVEWADPDKITELKKDNEPYFSQQYYLSNSTVLNGVNVDINVQPAWNVTLGVHDIKVMIVDDGMDLQQADLGYWCTPSFFWAYDAFLNQFPDTPTNPHANDRHGTAVAGLINGCHNSVGIAGIAPGSSTGIIRIFSNRVIASNQAVADGINWAWATAGAHVLSNSWGGGAPSQLITDAINNAATQGRGGKGMVVVFSAGNTSDRAQSIIGPVNWQAAVPNVIAVSAINRDGQLANYAPEGAAIDIVAPTSHTVPSVFDPDCSVGDVLTTDRGGPVGCNDGPNNDQAYTFKFGGTSAAAPQVAAAAALLLTVNPNLTRQQVTSLLLDNADRGGSWANANQFGRGKLNIGRAMNQLVPPPPPPPSASITGPGEVQPYATCSFAATSTLPNAPYTYAWFVNDVPVGFDGSYYYHTAGSAPFNLMVTITNTQGLQAHGLLSVAVNTNAPQCLDQ